MADRLPPSDFDPLKGASLEPSDLEISARQRRLWSLFQHTATSLTHLYKCKSKCQNTNHAEDQESWLAFQSAASSLTSLYRESADILASLEKPNTRVSSTITSSSSDLSSPLRTSSNNIAVSACQSKSDLVASCTATSKPPSNSPPNDLMNATAGLESEEEMITNSTTNPPPPFDFRGCSKFKRSWSPWPDDDMDHFGGAKRRKFL